MTVRSLGWWCPRGGGLAKLKVKLRKARTVVEKIILRVFGMKLVW